MRPGRGLRPPLPIDWRTAERADGPRLLRHHLIQALPAELVAARGDDHIATAGKAGLSQADRTTVDAALDRGCGVSAD